MLLPASCVYLSVCQDNSKRHVEIFMLMFVCQEFLEALFSMVSEGAQPWWRFALSEYSLVYLLISNDQTTPTTKIIRSTILYICYGLHAAFIWLLSTLTPTSRQNIGKVRKSSSSL